MLKGLDITTTNRLTKFSDIRSSIAALARLNNPDQTVEMSHLRITPELNIDIPGFGTFEMTVWAKRQLGSLLGVQWDKWFDPKIVSHSQIQEELQRRFSKTGDKRKLRTCRPAPDAVKPAGCDGYLRAFLSPQYHTIDDERVFDRLERRLHHRVSEFSFLKGSSRPSTPKDNDHCSYYTLVGPRMSSFGALNINASPTSRLQFEAAERDGHLPPEDFIYFGMQIRNSEVGFSAITIDEYTFRLVCLNGMIISAGKSRLLYRQHRSIDDNVLDGQLNGVFDSAPARWDQTENTLRRLQTRELAEPKVTLSDLLQKRDAPKHFIEESIRAFDEEPIANMFGVVQAVTRAARTYGNLDRRYEYEALAGDILSRA